MWSIAELVIELLADDVPKWVKEQRDRLRARYILFRLRREHWMEKECRDARFCGALIHKHYPRCLLFDLHYRKQFVGDAWHADRLYTLSKDNLWRVLVIIATADETNEEASSRDDR
ncbi:hypothetical protein [Paenibacillus aquistagni]|uniref:hypothetical protein n=1 Tax=Paenibacillus aquistagni TaxID=1852522 RepID=UPI00145B02E0|nr:hypothetical protein [Paenibacillus aquistagni]NMM51320.1 hypothetical protein [Paenibacillus aquistagni]